MKPAFLIETDPESCDAMRAYFASAYQGGGLFSVEFVAVSRSEDDVFVVRQLNGAGREAFFEKPVRLGDVLDFMEDAQVDLGRREPFSLGAGRVDPLRGVFERGGAHDAVRLTEKEVDLLVFLHSQDNKSSSRSALLAGVWGYVESVETHTLETHIYRLRQKIEDDPSAPKILITQADGTYVLGQ